MCTQVRALARGLQVCDFCGKCGLLPDTLFHRLWARVATQEEKLQEVKEEVADEALEALNQSSPDLTASKIDVASARSAALKEDVKELQANLATLAKEQAEMDKMRSSAHANYLQAKSDLEAGLQGVRQALSVLREYYGGSGAAMIQGSIGDAMSQPAKPEYHTAASGAGSGIIGLLEVVESDFASGLASEETTESDAQTQYEKVSQENAITRTTMNQDVTYKTKEFKGLDKELSELVSDRETTNTELEAVLEYYSKIKERCIAKPETYEERKRRREAEIQGLKEALDILESETAFTQRTRRAGQRGIFLGLSK
ncbi:unnamed protein product [Prorocentrum cordatum]|uniref:Uncharacterized protein n=1 Tax=Prorocentrum cordatum TaxID=2364126 RepID=A0ABN9VN91_9DINO|nr:unnamed protein product [Polarella glacialis]